MKNPFNKEKAKRYTCSFIVSSTISYLCFFFVTLEPNPVKWGEFIRLIYALSEFSILLFIFTTRRIDKGLL